MFENQFSAPFQKPFNGMFVSKYGGDTGPLGDPILYMPASNIVVVEMSVGDYSDVDASVRDIFFADESTLNDYEDIYEAAISHPLLNAGTMVGSDSKGVVLYQSDSTLAELSDAWVWAGSASSVYFVNPGSGSDSNDGDALDAAWETVQKLNTEAATWTERTKIVIDTRDAPLYIDEALTVNSVMDLVGYGVNTIEILDKDLASVEVSDNAADIRPYKTISTFTQPDSGSAPNVWGCSDTETGSVLFGFDGWSGNTQPLVWKEQVINDRATLNSTADGYYNDGSTIEFYSTTDPNSDGSVWVRTQPSIFPAIDVKAGGMAKNLCVGGTTGRLANGSTQTDRYALRCNPESYNPISISNIFAYCGSDHIIGVINHADSANITWENVRWEQGPPEGSVPAVLYINDSVSGGRITLENVTNTKVLGIVGDTEGGEDASIESILFHGATEMDSITFNGGYIGSKIYNADMDIVSLNFYDIGVYRPYTRTDSLWNRCRFYNTFPYNDESVTTTIRNSRLTTEAPLNTTYPSIEGEYDVQYCTIDPRLHTGNNESDNRIFNRNGTLNFIFKNNIMVLAQYPFVYHGRVPVIRNLLSAEDTYEMDYNTYVQSRTVSVIATIDSVDLEWADMVSAGLEANGQQLYTADNADPETLLDTNSDLIPSMPDSPSVDSAESLSNGVDYTNTLFTVRNDAGAYEFSDATPYGPPLLFVPADGVDTITLSAEVLAGLTTEQQTDIDTQGNLWADFDALYTWVSAQDWFNAGNVMGDNVKGVAFYDESTSDSNFIRYSGWWPVNLTMDVFTNYTDDTNYLNVENYTG